MPKTLWPFRQALFLFSASSIHISRRCCRESPDSWSRKARFFSTQPRSLANAAYPAAVGIRDARNLFQDGELLDVDGYTGKVIKRHVG